jgi:hypothetical protein
MQKVIARRIASLGVVAGVVSLLSTPAIYAQSSDQPPSARQPMEQSQNTVSDGELRSFAKAYVEVEEIRVSHEAALNNVQEPEQTQKIQQEANIKMAKALEKQGLTPESYMQILNAVNSDGELTKKALDLIAQEKAS